MRTSVLWMSMAFLLLLSAGCRKKGEPDRVFDRKYLKVIKDAREEAFFYLARNFVPGSSIALSIDGKLVWSEGMGQSSTDLEVLRQQVHQIPYGGDLAGAYQSGFLPDGRGGNAGSEGRSQEVSP